MEHGGQNPIEPALYGKPVVSGRYIFNFLFVYQELEKAEAVKLVASEDELFVAVKNFLSEKPLAELTGQRAQAVVEKLAGTSLKTLEKIKGETHKACVSS